MNDTQEVVTQNTESDNPEGTEGTEEATKNVVISVENPSEEEMKGITEKIHANYNFDVEVKPVNFKFKKSTDKETGIETVRNTVQLAIPYPSVAGIVAILETGGTQLELLMEVVKGEVDSQARALLYENLTLTASTFPVEKLSWEAIANLPRDQRRGGGIAKEIWEGFGQDYVKVMPDVTGKSLEQVGNMAKILVSKLTQVRTQEAVLNLVVESLAMYAEASPNIEEFQECVAFLLQKANTYLNVTDAQLLENL